MNSLFNLTIQNTKNLSAEVIEALRADLALFLLSINAEIYTHPGTDSGASTVQAVFKALSGYEPVLNRYLLLERKLDQVASVELQIDSIARA